MSRISCVRSTTRAVRAFSSARCCDGSSSPSTRSTSARESPYACFSSSSLPFPTYVRASGLARCWTSSPIGSTPAVRASSRSSPSSSSASADFGSTASTSPAFGLDRLLARRHTGDCATLVADVRPRRPACRPHARAREHPIREPQRGGDRCARPFARPAVLRARVRRRRRLRLGAAREAPDARSSCSPATTTRCLLRRTSPAGSRTAPWSGSERAT